jgi:hypothetical protein
MNNNYTKQLENRIEELEKRCGWDINNQFIFHIVAQLFIKNQQNNKRQHNDHLWILQWATFIFNIYSWNDENKNTKIKIKTDEIVTEAITNYFTTIRSFNMKNYNLTTCLDILNRQNDTNAIVLYNYPFNGKSISELAKLINKHLYGDTVMLTVIPEI